MEKGEKGGVDKKSPPPFHLDQHSSFGREGIMKKADEGLVISSRTDAGQQVGAACSRAGATLKHPLRFLPAA
jgi:hypothetical protein